MATKIYLNGNIYTSDPNNPHAEAIVTEGSRILFCGSENEALAYKSVKTEVTDLERAFVMPGFIDCHTHMLMGGEFLLAIPLNTADSKERFRKIFLDYIAIRGKDWITGGNWRNQNWPSAELPHKAWIDDITSEIPVFVPRMDYHMGLANSYALRLAGIDEFTPDPPGGKILKDSRGRLTGILQDKAMDLVNRVIPEPDIFRQSLFLDTAIEYALSLGVTSVHDIAYKGQLKIFQKYDFEGRLGIRVFSRLPIEYTESIVNADISNITGSEFLRMGSLKAFSDGSLGSSTAYFREAYSDDLSNYGLPMEIMTNGDFLKWAKMADMNKFQLSVHAIGDRAIGEVLDVFEEVVRDNPKWDRRFRIEHAQHMSHTDFDRMRKSGVIASIQPLHLYDDGSWMINRIGKNRMKYAYAFRSLLENGINLCFGTDWPVVNLNPLETVYAAITRHTSDGMNPDGLFPEEKLTIEESLRAYTAGAAYASFDEKIKGSLEKGKLADFIILDHDLLKAEPDQIKSTKILMTVVGGKIKFQR